MPGLLRGVARTAVIAGTASGVAGRVQRRQGERFAERDASIAAQRQQAYETQIAPETRIRSATTGSSTDATERINQLKELADLKAQGILTEEEFAAQKAKVLGD